MGRAFHAPISGGSSTATLKPSNIVLDAEGRPPLSRGGGVIDFGLAKRIGGAVRLPSGVGATPS